MKFSLFILALVIATGPVAQAFPAYHDISEHDQAQAEARQRHLPLAWLGGFPEDLNVGSPRAGSQADLEQMALATLQDNAVVIFFDGRNMAPVPALVHAQFHIQDDGPLPNGAAWKTPKVVFTNPEVTQILGRVAATEMSEDREVALNSALQIIRNNPAALAAPAPVATDIAGTSNTTQGNLLVSGLSAASNVDDFWHQYGLYLMIGFALIVGFLLLLASSRR